MVDFFETEMALADAKGIAFDGCHKIYVLMDDAQMAKMVEYGYGEDDGSYLITADEMTKRQMLTTLENWYENSCGLRFINGVSTVDGDPNEGFVDLIPQGAEWEDECEDCGEERCQGVCNDYEDGEDEDENDY
jgi:hypothetical protein